MAENSIRLRDGSVVADQRLDRLTEFDERSRQYPSVARLSPESARRGPRSYRWRLGTRLDQGQEGACVGFSFTHELVARPAEVTAFTDPDVGAMFARETVYWEAQRRDPWDGGAYPGAQPFYEGTSILAGAQVLHDLGYFKEYRWAFGEDDLALSVGYLGPAVIGVNWYEGMSRPNQHGFIRPEGARTGGHAIVVTAVRVRSRQREDEFYELTNSWGADWGDGGVCRITRADMRQLLQEDGEACIPIGRRR